MSINRAASIISIILAVLMIAGCAAPKAAVIPVDAALTLRYKIPDGQTLSYKRTNSVEQIMDMMGQEVHVTMKTGSSFSFLLKGGEKEKFNLGVTIDSMNLHIVSPQGEMYPDTKQLIGKTFTMVLSDKGKESDIIGAEGLTYSLGQSGDRSIASEFQMLFPDFPEKPVKIGDTWTTIDTMTVKTGGTNMAFIFSNLNTLVGVETYDGKECLKVTAATTGSMEGSGQQGPADLVFKGVIKGIDTYLFAQKEGILVKTSFDGIAEANISVSGAGQDMVIPMRMKMVNESLLVK